MNWPLSQDYNEAVQNPATAFADPDLAAGQAVVGPAGLPLPRSGNFADVYQIRTGGRDWAVKCFTRPVTGLEQRYARVQETLARAALPFTVGFAFLPRGVYARGQWVPAAKLEWVDGLQLNQAVREQAGNPKALDALFQMWTRLCKRLREAGIAHADLQHGNVLLVPGAKPGAYGLKLIDYDGMYVPALANTPSGEGGHPNYQHPDRAAKHVYSPDLDRFPHLVIATALKALAVVGPALWERYDTGDNLLFTDEDFRNPAASRLMRELWATGHPDVQALVGNLALASGRPVPQTLWLDQIAPEGAVIPLPPDYAHAAACALGFGPAVPAGAAVPDAFTFDPADAPPPTAKSGTKPSLKLSRPAAAVPPSKSGAALPIATAAGVVLVLGTVGGIVALSGGKKPAETVQNEPVPPRPTEPISSAGESPAPPVVVPPAPPVVVTPPRRPPVVTPPPAVPPALVAMVEAAPVLKPRWDVETDVPPQAIVFTPNGQSIALRLPTPRGVPVYAAATGAKGAGFTETAAPAAGVVALADGNFASFHLDQPVAIVWSPATGKGSGRLPVGSIPGDKGAVVFDASPTGRYVAVGRAALPGPKGQTAAGTIKVYDTQANRDVLTVDVRSPKTRFTADGRFVVADVDRVRGFKLADGTADGDVPLTATPGARVLAVSADGSLVLHYAGGQPLRLLDARTGKSVVDFPGRFPPATGAISDNNRLVALAMFPPSQGTPATPPGLQVVVFDAEPGRVVGRFPLGTPGVIDVTALAFSPDGAALVVGRSTPRLQSLELPGPAVAAVPPMPKPPEPTPTPPVPAPADTRLAPPDAATLAKAEASVREILKADYAKKTAADKKALVAKLLKVADETPNDPPGRYVMLRDARDLAVEVGDPAAAVRAVEALAKWYAVDEAGQTLAALEKITAGVFSAATLRTVAELALAAADEATEADDYATAVKLAQTASSAARKGSVGGPLADEAEQRFVRARKAAEAFTAARPAVEKLKAAPDDPAANLAVGKFRCFTEGRWAEGLKALAKGGDAALKAAAELDLAAPPAGAADVAVADSWWAVAQAAADADRAAAEARARYWYARSLGGLSGLDKVRAETRLVFKVNGADYRLGLVAEFISRPLSLLKDKKVRVDPGIDFKAGELNESKATGELFAKWSGHLLAPRPGRYKLVAKTGDAVKVRVNGKVVIDAAPRKGARAGAPTSAVVVLPDRLVPLVVEYSAPNTDAHTIKLTWVAPGTTDEVPVPVEALYHVGGPKPGS